MNISIKKLTTPDTETANKLNNWTNDPTLVHLIRPNRDLDALLTTVSVTVDTLNKQLSDHAIYLIYLDKQLVGEMNFQIDPEHIFNKKTGTAWIGIVIGEKTARGKGVGSQAMDYIEKQIRIQKLKRIELGVFEFNTHAINFYEDKGYKEIGRIYDFTYWKGKMWQDIRMEKYLE